MANTLTAIIPRILARALVSLRTNLVMPRLVNTDYGTEAKKKGSTIDIPAFAAATVADVAPSAAPIQAADTTPSYVQLSFDYWKRSGFYLTDKDRLQIEANDRFIPNQMQASINILAETVNASIFSVYNEIAVAGGTAGTTPFASSIDIMATLKKFLSDNRVPLSQRRLVMDTSAEAKAIVLPALRDVSQAGDREAIQEGIVSRKMGFDWYVDQQVPTHTKGTGSGYLVNNGAGYAVGATAITLDTGTGTILKGDTITFAGDTTVYTVVSALASNSITIYPGLKATLADNTALTVLASHTCNLAFHRDAIAFASRPLEADFAGGNVIESMSDPVSGITLRLEVSRQNKQTLWDLDILWGVKLIRPDMACILLG